jgi:hypothetical protein
MNRVKTMKRDNIINSLKAKIVGGIYYPYLFVITFIVLQIARLNSPPSIGLIVITVGIITVFLASLIVRIVLRDKNKAKLFTALMFLLGIVYSSVFYIFKDVRINEVYIFNPVLLIITSTIILVLGFIYLMFKKVSFKKTSKILNKISLILLIIIIIICGVAKVNMKYSSLDLDDYGITINELNEQEVDLSMSIINNEDYKELEITKQNNLKEPENLEHNQNKKELYDIYFITVDGYTSERNLNNIFKFDNSNFYDFLENKEFHIARKSQGNYANTPLFVSSCLNMNHVMFLESLNINDIKKDMITTEISWNNKVAKFLKLKGYKYYHDQEFGSPNPYADYHGCGGYYQSMKDILKPTFFEIVDNKLNLIRRAQSKCSIKNLYKVDSYTDPIFAFIQLKQPHPPYVVDENGNAILATMDEGYMWKQKKNYINQIKFVNKELEKWIEYIINKTDGKVIIIIQGDHGSGSSFDRIDSENGGGWEYPTKKEPLIERMGIFNAYYIPSNINKNMVYDSITPVNSFRVLFNTLFETNYSLVSDDSLYSSKKTPYVLMNVTKKIKFND